MKKTDFRNHVRETIKTDVADFDLHQKAAMVRKCLVEAEAASEYDESNARKPYTDDELRVIFSMAPTEENCIRLAMSLKRGIGGIKQIYQWSAQTQERINEVAPNSKFHKQIKRVAKEMGWIL